MKKDYIKLYLDNVVCRLPQEDRAEVRRELSSNIYDMLPDGAGDAEIKSVLESLGPPARLAEKYRTNPRYLISPAMFDNYISVLKIGVPVVALVAAFAGFLTALIGIIAGGVTEVSEIMSEIIGGFLSSLFSGAFYAAVLITAGFVIYEHANKTAEKQNPKPWSADDLREVAPGAAASGISLTGSIASIAVTVCVSVFFVLLSLNILPDSVWFKYNNVEIYSFFSKEFLSHCLYVIPVLAAASIFTDALKIKYRRWTKSVIYSSIATSVIYLAAAVVLFTRPNMLSAEFTAFLRTLPVDSPAIIEALAGGKAIAVAAISIVTVIAVIGIAQSVYQLLKTERQL